MIFFEFNTIPCLHLLTAHLNFTVIFVFIALHYFLTLSTYLNFHFHLRLSPRIEEESLLYKEEEKCAKGEGDFDHATSHVSAESFVDF